MVEKVVIRVLLYVLKLAGRNKVPQEYLLTHANIKLAPARSSDTLIENLRFAQGKGWVASDVDDYGDARWWLTPAGEIEAG